jgi:hypothetical protein
MKSTLLIACLVTSALNNDFNQPNVIIPTLNIDQEIRVTDNNGKANPYIIIRLKPNDTIRIILQDKTVLRGLVKEVQSINNEMVKIFGDIVNKENTGFGFGLAKIGVFAGAVVFRDEGIIYTLTENKEDGGFYFIQTESAKKEKI